MTDSTNGGLIVSQTQAPAKTDEELILGGALDLDELADNIEQTVFLLDVSGSMRDPLDCDEYGYSTSRDPENTKIEMLKKALKRYIQTRFKKNPQSRVGMVVFHSRVNVVIDITDDEQELLLKASTLTVGGSTAMDRGLERAISLLKKSSKSWIPRIVLISDGMPDSQERVVNVIQNHQGTRIIIDTLYIGTITPRLETYVQFMREIAERTGGVFEHIANSKEFEQKFLQVANRPLLGAGQPKVGDGRQHQGGTIQL